MKKNLVVLATLVIVLAFSTTVYAACDPGTSWTAAWTDKYGQTTYTLEGPCNVYLGIPFSITARVTDNTYPDSNVGCLWSISDNGMVLASGGSGLGYLSTANGSWQTTLDIVYTSNPVDHMIQFSFTDLGIGASTKYWGNKLVGYLTVDPAPLSLNSPPKADAGPDIYFESGNQTSVVIEGRASDSDGDALSYQWLEGGTVLQSTKAVDALGMAPLNLAVLAPLTRGTHVFTLEVSDGPATATDNVVVSVGNTAPAAVASGAGTYQINDAIALNGEVSDFDGDTVTYTWSEGSTILSEGAVFTSPGGRPSALPEYEIAAGLPLGSHTLSLRITDGIDTVTENITVNVIDTTAPTLAPTASTSVLWPPNGGMTEVRINTGVHDNSSGQVQLSVRVSSNQPPRTNKSGRIIPDYSVSRINTSTGVIVLQLRSARSGKGGDRVYSIEITATDVSNNASTATVVVKVPHDRGLHKGRLKASHGSARKTR